MRYIVLLIFLLTSIDSYNQIKVLDGTYTRTFTALYFDGDTISNPVRVSFSQNSLYESTGNNNFYPAGGSGTYGIRDSIIQFKDANEWTMNFDRNTILDGEYSYSLDSMRLIISFKIEEYACYKYELIKE